MIFNKLIAAVSLLAAAVCGEVVTYERPSIYTKSAHFSLAVNGTDMYTVNYAGYDYVQLSMSEGRSTEFRISILDQPSITSYSITPAQLGIEATVDGQDLVFSVTKAHYLIVKINNAKEFIVMADPLETDAPDPKANNIFNVMDYGADATGAELNTAIQKAADAAGEKPGSIVYVPKGLYLLGNLIIRDKTSLYLAGGSVLRFTGNPDDYETLYTKTGLHPGTWWIRTEFDSTDIKVYGRGTIDGNGLTTRNNQYIAEMLVPVGTKNFEANGVLIRDSSFWAVVPTQVEDALLTNIKILDRVDEHNVTENDGIDVCESTRVTVRRAIAVANDDSFSAKTWPLDTGTTVPYPYPPRPLGDVLFEDCLAWTRCYGYKIGEGVWETQDGVTFRDSYVYSAGVGIGIHHKFGEASAGNITFENIEIERLSGEPGGQAGWLTLFVNDAGQGIGPIENILVKNIKARTQGHKRGWLKGLSDAAKLSGVTFTDVYMYQNSTPATSIEQMNLEQYDFTEDINIKNS